jgi:uroporphyrinogen decarboxylase
MLPVNNDARYQGVREDAAWAKERGLWTVGWINGFFSGVHYFLRDYAEFMMDLLIDPGFAEKLVTLVGKWNLEAADALCRAGVDCVGFCDDFGSERSMLISPDLYHRFFLPWHRRLCDVVHGHGKVVHMHSHGAIRPILPDIAGAGIDMLNPLDPDEDMDFADVRAAVGRKMVLCGGMNKHFFGWDRDTQITAMKETMSLGRKHGPHIYMDSGGIPENAGAERVRQFLRDSKAIRGGRNP